MEELTYTREDFRAWLESLPPDDPFCEPDRCPIAQYWMTERGADSGDILNCQASDHDYAFVERIDNIETTDDSRKYDWSHITPRIALGVLEGLDDEEDDELEGAA